MFKDVTSVEHHACAAGAHTRLLQDAQPTGDAVMEDVDDTADAAKETFSLGLTLLCHALRHAAEVECLPSNSNVGPNKYVPGSMHLCACMQGCRKVPSMKQADQAAAASQSQVCQKIGLPTLLANLDAVSQEQTLLSVFDQLQAAKVSCSGTCMAIWDPLVNPPQPFCCVVQLIYTTTIMMAVCAPSLRALAQPFLGRVPCLCPALNALWKCLKPPCSGLHTSCLPQVSYVDPSCQQPTPASQQQRATCACFCLSATASSTAAQPLPC